MTLFSKRILPVMLTGLLCVTSVSSVVAQNNAFKFSTTLGLLPYFGLYAAGPEFQYDRRLSDQIWLSFNASYYKSSIGTGYSLTPSVFSSFFETGIIEEREQIFNTDLLCQTSIHHGWLYFKPAVGLSIVTDAVNGPIKAIVKNQITTPVITLNQWETIPMMTTAGELELRPGRRFVMGVKGCMRINPNKNKPVRPLVFETSSGNVSFSNTYMHGVLSISARIGFLF